MKTKQNSGVFAAIRSAAAARPLLTAGTLLCVAASVGASLLTYWNGVICQNYHSLFASFSFRFCGLSRGPCRGLPMYFSVDILRLRLVGHALASAQILRCYIVTLSRF